MRPKRPGRLFPKDWARCANSASRRRAIPSILQILQSSFLLLLLLLLFLPLACPPFGFRDSPTVNRL
jgi:hypothetical protein